MRSLNRHWEGVYSTKAEDAVSWYQRHSSRSLSYIAAAATPSSAIIDVGGGASTLVDDLLMRGYSDLSVLDIAGAGLAKARARLGARASKVNWIVADIRQWQPPRRYEIWHDRALFHFLSTDEDRAAYITALRAGTKPGASVILATFAPDGPEKCSSLPVQRYAAEDLAALLGSAFVLQDAALENHETPSGTVQRFSYSLFRAL